MAKQTPCPICKLEEQDVLASTDYGRFVSYECARCGKFLITSTARGMAENRQFRPKLSSWIREQNERGHVPPEINSTFLREVEKTLPNYSPSEKQLILLRNLERRTSFPGHPVDVVSNFDFPLAWASQEEEFLYYLQSLLDRGLLRRTDGPNTLSDAFAFKFQLSPEGWNFLDQHAKASVLSDQAFVAMSFAAEMKPIWENSIRESVRKAGYKPYRLDAEPHAERIDAKIVTEIKNSRFLIADVTKQRPGVYFEAGFAIGLGIPVIWSVRKDDLENVHFDTRQYNHIVWETEPELSEQLYYFVCAIIGKGSSTDSTG
jgi:nucleoside 2-deoxyribosyltransferase